jgi:urease accessory protein
MAWHAHLSLDLALEGSRTVARFRHDGPLRILQSLYPEGDAVCHNVLVHPPGGLVGGDSLDIAMTVAPGAHGLVTTPGASRFYRSDGEPALQRTTLKLQGGARLEWLPLEALCYSGCIAENHLRLELEPGAEMIGWDITALGLPNADLPFEKGTYLQRIEMPGAWLEKGRIDAADLRLRDSPLGLAGNKCMATVYFACGSEMPRERRERALDLAREAIARQEGVHAGATAPNGQVIAVRMLAPLVEPAMALARQVRNAWRGGLWDVAPVQPRIWSM